MNNKVDTLQTNKVAKIIRIGKKYPFKRNVSSELDKQNEDFWALKDISLEIEQGEVLGIIGRNGAGKTTLLSIIAKTLHPTEGEIESKHRTIGLFNLGVGFQDELTGKDNIFLNGAIIGASRKELDEKLDSIIEFSELGQFINMPLGTYSQGMRLRLGFSIIANLNFDILVIDEVLAVGDTLFQNKCYERLMDFRRMGKTLIITSQSMELIDRLCDRVAFLDHGKLLFLGTPQEGINRYRSILNTEEFFVGPVKKEVKLVENTKKWADDVSSWNTKLGTKEVEIDSVEFINKLGFKTDKIKSCDPLKIRVRFTVKNDIKEPHFGVAIFRNDGVYCYGPNTDFDGIKIHEIKEGRCWFDLSYERLLLAPGEYRVSVSVWDKNETLAFDYHYGYYKLIITGFNNTENALLNIPSRIYPNCYLPKLFFSRRNNRVHFDLDKLSNATNSAGNEEAIVQSVRLLDVHNIEKDAFITNEWVKIMINFSKSVKNYKQSLIWVGIYRDDGIYCQGIVQGIGNHNTVQIYFNKLPLLPGSYKISFGVWNIEKQRFLAFNRFGHSFKTVFDREDHGTVYLKHKWRWDNHN